MSGVIIVVDRLKALALVPDASIYPGDIPLGKGLPAFGVKQVSGRDHAKLARGTGANRTERIMLTVHGASYTAALDKIIAARKGLRNLTGTIAGFANVAIVVGDDGPDFELDDASIHQLSTDFSVSYYEANA